MRSTQRVAAWFWTASSSWAETGLDEVDDLVAKLRKRMRKGQLVVTSQVDLPRTGFERKLVLSGLDAGSSRRLLRSLVRGDAQLDGASEARLLDFAEGHPLALRLIAALVEFSGVGEQRGPGNRAGGRTGRGGPRNVPNRIAGLRWRSACRSRTGC